MAIVVSRNSAIFLLGISGLLFCSCASLSDPGTIYRPTSVPIHIDELPQLVSEQIEVDCDDSAITRVLKWGDFPYHYFKIELENGGSLKYNPDGSFPLRSHGGIL